MTAIDLQLEKIDVSTLAAGRTYESGELLKVEIIRVTVGDTRTQIVGKVLNERGETLRDFNVNVPTDGSTLILSESDPFIDTVMDGRTSLLAPNSTPRPVAVKIPRRTTTDAPSAAPATSAPPAQGNVLAA